MSCGVYPDEAQEKNIRCTVPESCVIFRELAKYKEAEVVERYLVSDHLHMCLSMPVRPRLSSVAFRTPLAKHTIISKGNVVKKMIIAVLVSMLVFTPVAEAKKKGNSPPKGNKVASGKQFDIYAELKESRPFAGTNLMLNIYATTVVVHNTQKHGRQLYRSRLEAIDADLLDPSMWQVGDFDADGYDDYRAVAGSDKNGCRTWATQTWLPQKERFTFGVKIQYLTDASGKQVKTCSPRKQKLK